MNLPEIELVRLSEADAGEILTLQRAAYVTEAQLHNDPQIPPLVQSLDQLRAELADPGCTTSGIRRSGRLLASVRVYLIDRSTAEIRRAAVVPDLQGQGLGTALLLAAEDALPAEVATVRLFTGEHSHANQRLYQRLGYQETRRTPAGSYQIVHMAKSRWPGAAPASWPLADRPV